MSEIPPTPYPGGDDADSLRVLLTPTPEMDVEGLARQLEGAVGPVETEVASEPESLRRSLQAFQPHLVLAAGGLPELPAAEARRIVEGFDPELPVILVTDELSRESQEELFPLAFSGLVFEGRLDRLASAVTEALSAAEARRRARAAPELRHVEESGRLAGAIAHDVNNVLTGILANAQLAEMSLPPGDEENIELLSDIVASTRRGAELVKRVMTLARPDVGQRSPVDVGDLVKDSAREIRGLLPEHIEVAVRTSGDPLPCVLDAGGLGRTFVELARNAADAMPEGGRLEISATRQRARDRLGRVVPSAVVAFEDTGHGMPREVRDRIFEPFFSTKDSGLGTGLGLATARRYVVKLDGSLTVESSPDSGTRVRMILPLRGAASPEGPATSRAASAEPPAPARARARILVADDQEVLRRVIAKALERSGHQVLQAADGDEAMEILRRHGPEIDLVLADLVMPSGGGGRLYRETLEWPSPPRFLLTSGYGPEDLGEDAALPESVPFLSKPWTVEELTARVLQVLETA